MQNNFQKVEHYLKTFKELLIHLKDENNFIIGGIWALKLHGLIVSRETNDLDLVIYNPTPKQLQVLKALKFFEYHGSSSDEYNISRIAEEDRRSFKFKKNDLIIDILLDYDRDFNPNNYLSYKDFNIQSIEKVMEAKRKYRANDQKYVREKDVIDFLTLKNENFNL